MQLAVKATEYAKVMHILQKRKYTHAPYFEHIAAVQNILDEWGYGEHENIMAAAALHDVVEDVDVPLSEIRREFGDEIAELVWWLTDFPTGNKVGNRDSRTLASAWRLARAPWEAMVIKAADIADNTKDILAHDAKFAAVYLPEKARLLDMMVKNCTEFRVMCLLDKVREGLK